MRASKDEISFEDRFILAFPFSDCHAFFDFLLYIPHTFLKTHSKCNCFCRDRTIFFEIYRILSQIHRFTTNLFFLLPFPENCVYNLFLQKTPLNLWFASWFSEMSSAGPFFPWQTCQKTGQPALISLTDHYRLPPFPNECRNHPTPIIDMTALSYLYISISPLPWYAGTPGTGLRSFHLSKQKPHYSINFPTFMSQIIDLIRFSIELAPTPYR